MGHSKLATREVRVGTIDTEGDTRIDWIAGRAGAGIDWMYAKRLEVITERGYRIIATGETERGDWLVRWVISY